MRIAKRIVIVVLALLLVAVVIGVASLNSIVRRSIETQATNSLDLKTTLSSAKVSLLGQSLSLKQLQITQPHGFSGRYLFEFNTAKVDVSLSHLRSDPVAIDKIEIDKPKVVIEQVNGRFNFQALMNQSPKKNPKPDTTSKTPAQPVKLILHDLVINSPTVTLIPGVPGLQKSIIINLESFEMKDIGTGDGNENGVAIKEIIVRVMTELAQRASKSDGVPPAFRELLTLNADDVKTRVSGLMNQQIGELSKNLAGQLNGSTTNPTTQGIGNLLNGLTEKTSTTKPAKKKKHVAPTT